MPKFLCSIQEDVVFLAYIPLTFQRDIVTNLLNQKYLYWNTKGNEMTMCIERYFSLLKALSEKVTYTN
jgi:hypothetical protein